MMGEYFFPSAFVVVVIFLFAVFRIVPEYQRMVILRFGKVLPQPKGPGIVIVIPLVDRPIRVDLSRNLFSKYHTRLVLQKTTHPYLLISSFTPEC